MTDACQLMREETEDEISVLYFICMGCNTMYRKIFTIAICFCFAILCIILMKLLFHFIKHNRQKPLPVFGIMIFYILFVIIFYITIIIQCLNHCFVQIGYIQWITWQLKLIGYTGGFQLYLIMLYYRLWFVFNGTSHHLSQCNVAIFISINIFGFVDLVLMLFNNAVWWDFIDLSLVLTSFGIFCIIVLTFWIVSLYIYKLYVIVQGRERYKYNRQSNDVLFHDDKMVRILSKHTLLTIMCLFGTMLTLCMSTFNFFIPVVDNDFFWVKRTKSICLAIDITSNVLLFILGYTYVDGMYNSICGCMDTACRKSCKAFVLCSVEKQMKITLTFSPEITPSSNHRAGVRATNMSELVVLTDDELNDNPTTDIPNCKLEMQLLRSISNVNNIDTGMWDDHPKQRPKMMLIPSKSSCGADSDEPMSFPSNSGIDVPSDHQLRHVPEISLIQSLSPRHCTDITHKRREEDIYLPVEESKSPSDIGIFLERRQEDIEYTRTDVARKGSSLEPESNWSDAHSPILSTSTKSDESFALTHGSKSKFMFEPIFAKKNHKFDQLRTSTASSINSADTSSDIVDIGAVIGSIKSPRVRFVEESYDLQ